MPLKVGLVACSLNTEHIRGMGKYIFELLRESAGEPDLDWVLFGNDPRYGMTTPQELRVSNCIFTFKGDRFYLWEQLGLPLKAFGQHIDLLHCTEGSASLWQPKPTVITVHDTLAWEEHSKSRVDAIYYENILPAAMKRSSAVVTISDSSKNDILNRWPMLESKLHVIPHGIEDEYFKMDSEVMPSDLNEKLGGAPYLVYLGGPMERKRFGWALEVLARSEQQSLKMIACGFNSTARDVAISKVPRELVDRVHFASFLSNSELRALYRNAQAVLYPTLYEGFGFPAVEAQAAGVPVIFSALGSLKELVGPLAIIVRSDDMEAWLRAVADTAVTGVDREQRIKAAKLWAMKFSWKESFRKHLAVYRLATNSAKRS